MKTFQQFLLENIRLISGKKLNIYDKNALINYLQPETNSWEMNNFLRNKNQVLRSKKKEIGSPLNVYDKRTRQSIKYLQNVIRKHRTTEQMLVHRGTTYNEEDDLNHLKYLKNNIGKTIRIRGFNSTSTKINHAFNYVFLGRKGSFGIFHHIILPPGTPAFNTKNFVASHNRNNKSSKDKIYQQHEVILPHGSRFQIHKIEKSSEYPNKNNEGELYHVYSIYKGL